jgi:hypothetical protein
MRPSAEVRWIVAGDFPSALVSWFSKLGAEASAPTVQMDRYLRPTDPGLNIKLRQDRVEAKRRSGNGVILPLHLGIVGRVEMWNKWTFPLCGNDAFNGGGFWLDVYKERHRLVFDWAELAVPGNGPSTCTIEISQLRLHDRLWWTLCLEACGSEEYLVESLSRTSHHVFSQGRPPHLDLGTAMSYPAWLLGLENGRIMNG